MVIKTEKAAFIRKICQNTVIGNAVKSGTVQCNKGIVIIGVRLPERIKSQFQIPCRRINGQQNICLFSLIQQKRTHPEGGANGIAVGTDMGEYQKLFTLQQG